MDNLFSLHQEKLLEFPELKNTNGSQITTIICLYSKSSPASIQFITSIPQHLKTYIYFLSIDNEKLRNKILRSKNLKIKQLPCIIIADTSTTVSVFENSNINNIIQSISDNYDYNNTQESHTTTPIFELSKRSSQIKNDRDFYNENNDKNENEDEDDDDTKFDVRKKSKMNKNSINPPMQNRLSLPKKGQYHDKMAKSSLNIGLSDQNENGALHQIPKKEKPKNSVNTTKKNIANAIKNLDILEEIEDIEDNRQTYHDNDHDDDPYDDDDVFENKKDINSTLELNRLRDEFELGNKMKKSDGHIKSMASIMENERNSSIMENERI